MKADTLRTNPSLAGGAVLIVLGILLFIGQFAGERFWSAAWPLVIITPGLLCFVGMVMGGKNAGGLAVPGSIVTTIGLLLWYQNTFNHFESWAYAWALIPTAVGLGMLINGVWSELPDLVKKGQDVMRIGLIMLLAGFASLRQGFCHDLNVSICHNWRRVRCN